MKKLYSILAIITLISATASNINTMDPEPHSPFKLLDQFMDTPENTTNWIAIFAILQKLVESGNVFAINTYRSTRGVTLLYQAVKDNDFVTAKILLKKYHVNPNEKNSQYGSGNTPLMLACLDGNINMIKLLLKYGANPFIKNDDGVDSYYYADFYVEINNNDTVLSILHTYQRK